MDLGFNEMDIIIVSSICSIQERRRKAFLKGSIDVVICNNN
jgi:hypothetical protein